MNPLAARRLALLLLALTMAIGLAAPAAAVDGDRYVALANAKRSSVGRPPVAYSGQVDVVAIERAEHIARTGVFAHDLAYIDRRLREVGVCFTTYGEIIAWESGYSTYDPARTIEQWWRSQGHHDIIIGDYNAAGGSHAASASGRTYSVMIFVKLCSGASVARLAGGDRYATAAAISQARFGPGVSTAFVATGERFPDALAGSPAAARANGPILLTTRDGLPAATAAELARLRPTRIVILGGAGAVGEAVAAQLRSYAQTVVRWAGVDRYDTAAAISRSTFAAGVPVAYVATGVSFPDALSGGAIAGRDGGPILLVTGTGLPGATANELARLRPARIVILGGTGAVGDAVAHALRPFATSGSVTRLAGSDRYATAVEVSRAGFGGAGSDTAFVATGTNFPDGLAGGPVAALVPGPLLLVKPNALPASVAAEIRRLDPDRIYVLGGPGSVTDAVMRAAAAAAP